jgi:hypothetical protein
VVVHTSSGDRILDADDLWAVTAECGSCEPGYPAFGPAGQPPIGYLLGSPGNPAYRGAAAYGTAVFSSSYPDRYPDRLGFVFELSLQPGQTARLAATASPTC